VNKLNMTNNN